MKQAWQRFAAKIDALGLRERLLVFLGAAAILIELVNVTALNRQIAKEAELSQQIAQDQSQIAGMQAEIRTAVESYNHNPDVAKQAQLSTTREQLLRMRESLQDMQKGLVSPDRMTGLLGDILKQNGKLHLVSLRTLPTSGLIDAGQTDGKAGPDKAAVEAAGRKSGDNTANLERSIFAINDKTGISNQGNMVYKHGVEVVIEGDYFDMVNYMTVLESIPSQLYWGKAQLTADDSFKLSLTLTLYTLSLDKKWLNL